MLVADNTQRVSSGQSATKRDTKPDATDLASVLSGYVDMLGDPSGDKDVGALSTIGLMYAG